MSDHICVSIAMATYNGEKYLGEQLNSILLNLSDQDEVIISDDGSTDKTIEIIQAYMHKDKRIRLIEGPHSGLIANFENAIQNTSGTYIFLSDQDDIWMKNKVAKVLKCFQEHQCSCVVHNAQVIDENMQVTIPSFFSYRNSKAGIIHNLIKNSYIGCCMAFHRELLDKILPIPKCINMHDQWIGLISDKFGRTVFLDEVLFSYRRHSSNVSAMEHYPLKKMIEIRKNMFLELVKRK